MPKLMKSPQYGSNSKHPKKTFALLGILGRLLFEYFSETSIWLWSIAIGFAPPIVKALRKCELANKYSFHSVYMDVFGDVDIIFSLFTIYYAIYVEAERSPLGKEKIIRVLKNITVVIMILLLGFWGVLFYSPNLQNQLNQFLITIHEFLLMLTLAWGLFFHFIFVMLK